MNINKQKTILLVAIILFAVVWTYFLLFKNSEKENGIQQSAENKSNSGGDLLNLAPQINDEGGVSVEAVPVEFSINQSVKFQITFTTHQGDLDFDLTEQAILYDDQNKDYFPISWDGGRGGHHLSGILIFSKLSQETKTINLIIKDVYGIARREFKWEIK